MQPSLVRNAQFGWQRRISDEAMLNGQTIVIPPFSDSAAGGRPVRGLYHSKHILKRTAGRGRLGGEEMPTLNCILIAAVSTAAIVATWIMSKLEPDNRWYVWYVAGLNLISVFLYGWLVA